MESHSILASISVANRELDILGGEVSADIEAEDEDAAVEVLENLLNEYSSKGQRSYSVLNHEIFENDDDAATICITVSLNDISEINWITFYCKPQDIEVDDLDDSDISDLTYQWFSKFFDEDNQIVVEIL